ncbi:uncharacterized protein LOC144119942 [Amblyomma americanum]
MAAVALFSPQDAVEQATPSVSPRTQARTNIKIQNPTLWSKEQLVRASQPTPTVGEPVRPTQVQQVQSPTGQGRGIGDPSFDSFEEVPLAEVESKFWPAVWALTSVICITLLIPLSVLLLPYATSRTRGPCLGGQCATTTKGVPGSSKGPFSWRTAEFVEDVRLPSNLSLQQFCEQQVQPDPRTRPSGPMATNPKFNAKMLVQYRHVLCHLDTQ